MIDITKPLQVTRRNNLAYNNLRSVKPVQYVAHANGMIIVRYPQGGLSEFFEDTGLSSSGTIQLENAPVTHRRLVALYNIKGSIASIAVVDEAALDSLFVGMPGTVIAKQWVTVTEGEGMNQRS